MIDFFMWQDNSYILELLKVLNELLYMDEVLPSFELWLLLNLRMHEQYNFMTYILWDLI